MCCIQILKPVSCLCLLIFQSAIHVLLFIWLLRVCDIKSTGGDVRDACCPSDRRNNEVVPDHNTDVNHHEDIDVAEERSRVKAIQNDASLDVCIYSPLYIITSLNLNILTLCPLLNFHVFFCHQLFGSRSGPTFVLA